MTTVLMGPYATLQLGDMGADIIKVEPLEGDIVRQIGRGRHPGMGPMFLNVNRNKRSIALDLKQPAGREVLLRLAADSDVFIYNVRPQAMARLGLAYEDVAGSNPAIIYAGVFGYGQDGPYAARPAYDDLIQGACAIPTLLAKAGDGSPRYVPLTIADRIVGLFAVNAILAALRHRDVTGRGQRIDVPMFETMANFVLIDHLGGLTFDPPLDHGGYARLLAPALPHQGRLSLRADLQRQTVAQFLPRHRTARHGGRSLSRSRKPHPAHSRNLCGGRRHLRQAHDRGVDAPPGGSRHPLHAASQH
jgi:hypothetical protein